MPGQETASVEKTLTFSDHVNGSESSKDGGELQRSDTHLSYAVKFWKFKLRDDDDDEDADWWFASTGIPLIAATLAPLANVLSIAALVTYWRMHLYDDDGNTLTELTGVPYRDPRWCYWLNVASLILGFVGNLFLLFNFTNRVRYLIALPVTILCWYFATGILIAITACMAIYVPPAPVVDTYTQGYWYAVIAAILYCICSMILMVNMLGYFLGHYPQHFTLTDHQRTLILQTMLFFIWLAGGAAVFSTVEIRYGGPGNAMSYTDALYFCDVTILTVGFGDIYPHDNVGRGLVFPFSVGGIIMLGLVISSINKFAGEISEDKIVKRHISNARTRTLERTVTSEQELLQNQSGLREMPERRGIIRFFTMSDSAGETRQRKPSTSSQRQRVSSERRRSRSGSIASVIPPVRRRLTLKETIKRKPKLILLKEEKDRFEAMRRIEHSTDKFKRWWRLTLSVIAFGLLWCIGALVFWQCEKNVQGMTYFQGLYFCYVSLLTIGYGDLAPKSNAGRPFFVVWSLIAVPTMTILISDMGDTVISGFKNGTFAVADFTLLPKEGVWKHLIERSPRLVAFLQQLQEKQRIKRGMPGPEDDIEGRGHQPDLQDLAVEAEQDEKGTSPTNAQLARELASAIKRTAHDLTLDPPKKYSYEEWVELTRLIRFTSSGPKKAEQEEDEEGLIEWDWIGEDSPMMSGQTEAEFVLDRLSESLSRYMRRMDRSMRNVDTGLSQNTIDTQDLAETSAGDRTIKFADEHGGSSSTSVGILPASTADDQTDEALLRGAHWLGRRRTSVASDDSTSLPGDGDRKTKASES